MSQVTPSSLPQPATAAAPPGALGHRVAHGMAWMILVTMGSKAINIGGQIALAWLLLRSEFGLAGLAFTVSALVNVLQQTGQREVLIQRQAHIHRWVNPTFWMSAASGLLAGVLMAAAAPIAARVYKAPNVVGLILVLAAATPFYTLATVPAALLQAQLRFRLSAMLWFAQAAALMGLSVIFALLGCGAYSFVLPWPIVSVARFVVYWAFTRPQIRWNPQFGRWRYVLGDSLHMFIGRAALIFIGQASYITLGWLHSEDIVGTYYFAFNVSLQTVMLLAFSLDGVLFPALSKLQSDPVRQRDAFLSAARVLALIGVPACFLQAALADAAVRAVFGAKWIPAIPIIQLLSLGMAFRLIGWPSQSLIQAQGRFRIFMLINVLCAAAFAVVSMLGAWYGAAVGTALAASMYLVVEGPLNVYFAISGTGGTLRDVGRVYLAPLVIGILAGSAALAAGRFIPHIIGREWLRILLGIAVATGAFVPLARVLAPDTWRELSVRALALLRRAADAR